MKDGGKKQRNTLEMIEEKMKDGEKNKETHIRNDSREYERIKKKRNT